MGINKGGDVGVSVQRVIWWDCVIELEGRFCWLLLLGCKWRDLL